MKTRNNKQTQGVYATPSKDLIIEATMYGKEVWRAWLKDVVNGEVIAEAIGEKTIAEMVANPDKWAHKMLYKRLAAIEQHHEKLLKQMAELDTRAQRIQNLCYQVLIT